MRLSSHVNFAHWRPTLSLPLWQMCTSSQFEEDVYERIARTMFFPVGTFHRKLWEWAYIIRVLETHGGVRGKRGLGFGCGKEPLVSYFVNLGAGVTATDMDATAAEEAGWIATTQHSQSLNDLYIPHMCERETFDANVRFRMVDMNRIPTDLEGYDFVWSSCAFEHLGGLENGLAFVEKAMGCLKPGGVAVHTTEYNLSSNDDTLEDANLVLYRQRDILELAHRLCVRRYKIPQLNLFAGDDRLDHYCDLPPYGKDEHVKLLISKYVATSIGIFAIK